MLFVGGSLGQNQSTSLGGEPTLTLACGWDGRGLPPLVPLGLALVAGCGRPGIQPWSDVLVACHLSSWPVDGRVRFDNKGTRERERPRNGFSESEGRDGWGERSSRCYWLEELPAAIRSKIGWRQHRTEPAARARETWKILSRSVMWDGGQRRQGTSLPRLLLDPTAQQVALTVSVFDQANAVTNRSAVD